MIVMEDNNNTPNHADQDDPNRPIGAPPPKDMPVKTNKMQSDSSSSSTEDAVRSTVGQGMNTVSDVVNNNLIAFRYGTVATVTLLTAYGLANTPLFFRYKSVADIPAKLFTNRKRLRARLIETIDNDQAGQPMMLYVRHLSPMGTILSKNQFETLRKLAPSAQIAQDGDRKDLLKVEIAGISAPPTYTSMGGYQRGEWLGRLAKDNTMVKLQLLGRRVVPSKEPSQRMDQPSKRDVSGILPEVEPTLKEEWKRTGEEEQIIVGRLYYRPSLFQLFATDISDTLVRYGHASVESELFLKNEHTGNSRVEDASTDINDIRKDAKYLDKLGKLEYEAARGSYGMWSDAQVRDKRRDIVDEVEFQENASVWQKLWRWMKG